MKLREFLYVLNFDLCVSAVDYTFNYFALREQQDEVKNNQRKPDQKAITNNIALDLEVVFHFFSFFL